MKKIQTTWNMELLYKNAKSPEIEKDLSLIEKTCIDFEKKYKGKDFTETPEKLAKALVDYMRVNELLDEIKPWWYFALRNDTETDNEVIQAAKTKHSNRITEASNKTTFFVLAIGAIPKEKQKVFLSHKVLAPYDYYLKRIWKESTHFLSEKEEQMESLLGKTSYDMWVDGQAKLLSSQTITHKKEVLPISKALSILSTLSKKERDILSEKINTTLKNISDFAEAEINAVYTYKMIMDKQRGYAKPYSATVLSYENEEASVEALIAVVTKYFSLSKRFYQLHAKLLGQKSLTMADRGAKIGTITKKFSFDECVKIVIDNFEAVDPQYSNLFKSYLENGQVDVYPKKGKRGGAYCWGAGTLPTYVLLNHTDDIRSLETLAHEMGHAIHTEMSKSQPIQYRKYSTATAEVASTFFEQLVADSVMDMLPKKDQLILLHNKIMNDISTIFRQVACFNFELDLHTQIRKEGEISKETIAKLLAKNLKAYTGPAMEVTEDDGYFFVTWSHIRRFFYVYSYAYGQLISRALFEKYKQDKTFGKKVKQFLSAGKSMSPEDIFKSIGIDTSDPTFFETGLLSIKKDIDLLEKLAKETGKI